MIYKPPVPHKGWLSHLCLHAQPNLMPSQYTCCTHPKTMHLFPASPFISDPTITLHLYLAASLATQHPISLVWAVNLPVKCWCFGDPQTYLAVFASHFICSCQTGTGGDTLGHCSSSFYLLCYPCNRNYQLPIITLHPGLLGMYPGLQRVYPSLLSVYFVHVVCHLVY